MLNTQAVKRSIYHFVRTVNMTSIGRRICQVFLDAQLNLKSTIQHGEICMDFVTPNLLSHYRAISFSVKEPDTLEWIDKMPKNGILWDVGANVGLYSIYAAKRAALMFMHLSHPSLILNCWRGILI